MALKTKQERVKVCFGNIKTYIKEIEESLNSYTTYDDLESIEMKIDKIDENLENAKQLVTLSYDELEE